MPSLEVCNLGRATELFWPDMASCGQVHFVCGPLDMLQLSELQVHKVEKFAIIVVTEATVPAIIVS